MKKFIICLFIFFPILVRAQNSPPPLISIGGGWWMAGEPHHTALFQAEYKWGSYWLKCIRPEACLVVPANPSLFIGLGIAIDLYLSKHFVVSPNFCPGYYVQGKGKNLGCPLEFRSALEAAYEFNNKIRFGTQFWHISNASLGKKNPGVNALTLFIAFPM